MATYKEVIEEIKSYGSESTKKVLMKHGAKEPFYGAKIDDLKKILKRIKHNQELAMQLYDSGISDAMYLAGLVADGAKMTKAELQHWAEKAYWSMLSEYTVPWVASENPDGWTLALQWIDSENEQIASAGWSTISALIATKPDGELDMRLLKKLLERAAKEIHRAPNRVRHVMNGFIIALGSYVTAFTNDAIAAAEKIDKVSVDMGDTACKVPSAKEHIQKAQIKGTIGRKKKTAKC